MKFVSLSAAVVAALVSLSGCVAYPHRTTYSNEPYGSDAEWRYHHHRDHWRYHGYDDQDMRDERARGQ